MVKGSEEGTETGDAKHKPAFRPHHRYQTSRRGLEVPKWIREKFERRTGQGRRAAWGKGGGEGSARNRDRRRRETSSPHLGPPIINDFRDRKAGGGDEIGADGKRTRGQGLNSPGTRLEFPGRDHAAYQPGGDGLNRQNGETRVTKQHPVQGLARRGTRTATTNDDTAEEAQMVWDAAGRKRGR